MAKTKSEPVLKSAKAKLKSADFTVDDTSGRLYLSNEVVGALLNSSLSKVPSKIAKEAEGVEVSVSVGVSV